MISHHTQAWYFVRHQWIPVIYDHTSMVLWKTQIVYLDGPSNKEQMDNNSFISAYSSGELESMVAGKAPTGRKGLVTGGGSRLITFFPHL